MLENIKIQLVMEHPWNTHEKKIQEKENLKALGTLPKKNHIFSFFASDFFSLFAKFYLLSFFFLL